MTTFNENDYEMYLSTIQISPFKSLFEILSDLTKEGNFEFYNNEIHFRHISNSKTVYIHVALKCTEIEKYICKNNIVVGLSIENLNKIFKGFKPGGSMNMYVNKSNTNKIHIEYISKEENTQVKYVLSKYDIATCNISNEQKTLMYENTLSIPAEKYSDICKSIKQFSGEIQLEYAHPHITFRGTDLNIVQEIILRQDENFKNKKNVNGGSIVQQTFDIVPLLSFVKTTGKVISISIENDMPLTLQTDISKFMNITLIIAPKDDHDN